MVARDGAAAAGPAATAKRAIDMVEGHARSAQHDPAPTAHSMPRPAPTAPATLSLRTPRLAILDPHAPSDLQGSHATGP